MIGFRFVLDDSFGHNIFFLCPVFHGDNSLELEWIVFGLDGDVNYKLLCVASLGDSWWALKWIELDGGVVHNILSLGLKVWYLYNAY